MILDISDSEFRNILDDKRLFLPIRWNGEDFYVFLRSVINYYISKLTNVTPKSTIMYDSIKVDLPQVEIAVGYIYNTVKFYLNGFPFKAYTELKKVMDVLIETPLQVYNKTVYEQFEAYHDELNLFRATKVPDNKPYSRSRIFHTPYNLRSKVSTSRYSIAGFPSLYMGTSLELCCEEIKANPYQDFIIASLFKLERSLEYSNTNIRVIELGIKPQDFIENDNVSDFRNNNRRKIDSDLITNNRIRSAFLLWYPLIAACSFIRTNKNDPFAAEYIVPQLLMQWVRNEMSSSNDDEYNQLIGIRYFSCASERASEMGFNYVFPTSGKKSPTNSQLCSVLSRSFRLTDPVYVNEYDNIEICEHELISFGNLGFV